MTGPDRNSIRVLFVDGDNEVKETVRDCFEAHDTNVEVASVGSVAAGVEHVERGDTDCVIAGSDIPDGTVLDLLEAVRERRPDLPVVLYPRDGSEELAAEAIAAGADGYRPREGAVSCEQVAQDVVGVVQERRERRGALDRMTDAFFAVDDDWRFTYLNERGRAFISEAIGGDYTVSQLRGKHLWEEIPDAATTTFYDEYTEAMETQEPTTFQEHYDPLDTWFEVRAYPSPSGLSVYFRDITEQKAYEMELERRETVLTRMYRVLADTDRTFPEKVDKLFAIGREELGTEYATLSTVEGEDYVFEFVQTPEGDDALEAGDVASLETTSCERAIVSRETLVISDMADASPDVADRQGNVDLGLSCYLGTPVVVDDDVTGTFCFYGSEPREEPFSKWEVTLVELMGNWVSYERERKLRERELTRERDRLDEFASVVSHDLRNPLNAAMANLELVTDECDSDHLTSVEDALDRMKALIEDILALARLGQQVVDEESTDFTSLVRTAWSMVSDGTGTLELEGNPATVVGDERRLQQLFENLFHNALEHGTVDGDGVTVRVGPLSDGRGFYVADDGPGIPPEDRDGVFEHGFTTAQDGTGFGLSIVAQIAAAHGGDVSVTESDDGGARFEVTGIDVG